MLSQIVERWGDLSDELKRAVLAVVGIVDYLNYEWTTDSFFQNYSLVMTINPALRSSPSIAAMTPFTDEKQGL